MFLSTFPMLPWMPDSERLPMTSRRTGARWTLRHSLIWNGDRLYVLQRWTLIWVWERTLLKGSLASASLRRRSIWTWRPQGNFLCICKCLNFFRYLKKTLEAGKRNGLELSGKELEEFKLVKKKISELGIAFRSCLSEDTSHIWVKEEELAGVPQDLVSTLEKSATGELKVTQKQGQNYISSN